MNKVNQPILNETWECPRCLQSYCPDCVDKHTVDFEIMDKTEGMPELKPIQWKGLFVCPWCYNQLIDLKEKKLEG